MPAHDVELRVRRKLSPPLFDHDDRERVRSTCGSPVETVTVSVAANANAKDARKRTSDPGPVRRFDSLPSDRATPTFKEVTHPATPEHAIPGMTIPTAVKTRALDRPKVDRKVKLPRKVQDETASINSNYLCSGRKFGKLSLIYRRPQCWICNGPSRAIRDGFRHPTLAGRRPTHIHCLPYRDS